ncbi:zinc transport system substrate-binding protein [Cribrihabitans marinus]|uniref:High-affinity zinc uptake system protein ZnuA n=1 Tax=Cribrihabitans marinus TaxID=1227549 RepID=A0A1H7D9P7_9RHOB|nr:zinc ABC transporter substrate-binding protein [Cribrihabitans marinus]GGH38256.1 zinc transporter [Cribrihabitans marinus]SEJ98458.1 zinc transport system substrate-binding protein [Cribrihabitans marinus]
MSRNLLSLSASAVLMGGTALADVPGVAVDIAPIHSLVARVMEGVGTPDLIVQPGASPHEYSLRPSEAASLQKADVVFWMGDVLTPWMEDAVQTLAEGAAVTTLLDAEGTVLLDFREGTLFEAHEREEHAEGEVPDDHGHDEHDEHDPHAWLSPENAGSWLNLIAAQLSAADPENAGTYFANASAAREEMQALSAEIRATLDPVREGSFIVFHDAYQYFETAFDFPASGAISLSDATDPSPARIAEIRERIREEGIDCVLAEPQFNAGIVDAVLDGTGASTGVIDPLGAELEPGPDLYPQLLKKMATTLAECL